MPSRKVLEKIYTRKLSAEQTVPALGRRGPRSGKPLEWDRPWVWSKNAGIVTIPSCLLFATVKQSAFEFGIWDWRARPAKLHLETNQCIWAVFWGIFKLLQQLPQKVQTQTQMALVLEQTVFGRHRKLKEGLLYFIILLKRIQSILFRKNRETKLEKRIR